MNDFSATANTIRDSVLHLNRSWVDLECPEANIWGGFDFTNMLDGITVRFTVDGYGIAIHEHLRGNPTGRTVRFIGLSLKAAAPMVSVVIASMLGDSRSRFVNHS